MGRTGSELSTKEVKAIKTEVMGDIEISECDFCKEIKPVMRTYLKPSKYIKPLDDSQYSLYNEGDYFKIIKTCNDCGKPLNN